MAPRRVPTLPAGFPAVPILPGEQGCLRACVIIRPQPDPVTGWFVGLRTFADGRVLLGALVDAADHLVEWLELRIQEIDEEASGAGQGWNNGALDDRWINQVESLAETQPDAAVFSGFEARHPVATWIDLARRAPVQPVGWELCQDDKVLREAGLPAFSTSVHRYLWQPGKAQGHFVPVTRGAPAVSGRTAGFDTLGLPTEVAPLNTQAGLICIHRLAPLRLVELADLAAGHGWTGMEVGGKPFDPGAPYSELTDWQVACQQGTALVTGHRGPGAQAIESLHLRVRWFCGALRGVRDTVARSGVPFLNLDGDSIRVALPLASGALPTLWNSRLQLSHPPGSRALDLDAAHGRHFRRLRAAAPGVFQPAAAATAQGQAVFRLRETKTQDGLQSVEGTLVLPDGADFGVTDLCSLRLALPEHRLDLLGNLYRSDSLARGEVRFRSVPTRLDATRLAALQAAAGAAFPRSPFEILPRLGSPCDLHALAVLGLRMLFHPSSGALANTVDELTSFARQMAAAGAGGGFADAAAVALKVYESESRFADLLGPHRIQRGLDPKDAAAWIPASLWSEILAGLARCVPGTGLEGVPADFGDAPDAAPDAVFNRPLSDWEHLVRRTSALVFPDWCAHVEMASVIQGFVPAASPV